VSGDLRDGRSLNLTSTSRGTNYASSDLSICSFGPTDGAVFAGLTGTCTITVTNHGFTATSTGNISTFSPTALGSVAIPGYANNVDANGGIAYVAAGAAGLVVVDATNPASPQIVATLQLDTRGNANDVRVVGNLAYVADGAAGLQIVDVSNRAAPRLVGSLDTPGEANDVIVSGNLAFIADGPSGLQIINVADPTKLTLVRTVPTPGTARGVDVAGSIVVVADDFPQPGLRVIDVSNPVLAAIVGSVPINGQPTDVSLGSGFAYVAAYTGGVSIVDVRQPATPTVVSTLPGSSPGGFVPRDVQVAGQFAIFAEQLFATAVAPIVDVSTPSAPRFRTVLDFGRTTRARIAVRRTSNVYWTGQSFFVGSENGTSGNTRLFIGQYLAREDRAGVPPTVTITAPGDGSIFIEGTSVTVRATATDDVAVSQVSFTVDGQVKFVDTSEPYQYTFTVPTGITTLLLGGGDDLGDNVGTAPTSPYPSSDPLRHGCRVVDRTAALAGAA
jgi:hypothetical protein